MNRKWRNGQNGLHKPVRPISPFILFLFKAYSRHPVYRYKLITMKNLQTREVGRERERKQIIARISSVCLHCPSGRPRTQCRSQTRETSRASKRSRSVGRSRGKKGERAPDAIFVQKRKINGQRKREAGREGGREGGLPNQRPPPLPLPLSTW